MSTAIGIISNANSGRNKKQLPAVEALLQKYAHVHHRVTHSEQDLHTALAAFAAEELTVVAINGGDGTLSQLLTALLRDKPFSKIPLIVMIPGGTANMHVGDIGRQGKLLDLLRQLCKIDCGQLERQNIISRPIFRIQRSGHKDFYGMFFGTGIVMHGIEYTHEKIHSKGIKESGPALGMLRTLWGLLRKDPRFSRPYTMDIQLQGGEILRQQSISLLVLSSLERLFLGLRPYWGPDRGDFHCSIVKEGADRLLRTLPRLMRGRPCDNTTPDKGYMGQKLDAISLWFDGSFTVDGELFSTTYESGPVAISQGGSVEFIKLS